MGIFGSSKQTKQLREEVQQLKKLALNSRSLETLNLSNLKAVNQNIALYPGTDLSTHAATYCNTDDVYSIVRRLSRTAAMIPMYAYEQTEDKKAFKFLSKGQKAWKNPVRYKSLQNKALTDLEEDDPVAMLLENPCDEMGKYEFFEAVHLFLCLFGECFILKEIPIEGVNQGKPIQLHILYPQGVIIKVSTALPRVITGYEYRINGTTLHANLTPEQVIHIKYFNPELNTTGNELRGLSPLSVLKKRLTRLDSGMNTSVAQLQNGGTPGVLFDKSPLSYEQSVDIIGQRKDNIYRWLRNPNNTGAPYVAAGEMGYIELGLKLADLTVAELANIDFKKLCNAFGVSDRLFNNDATGSEVSDDNARKALYTNTVLPNVFMVRDALVRGLLPDFKDGVLLLPQNEDEEPVRVKGDGKNRFIDVDISDITELHEDIAKQVTALAAAYWLSPNEKRETMNWERYDNPIFDEPLLPAGLVTLSDMEMEPPDETN